jgi:hypothetical protein
VCRLRNHAVPIKSPAIGLPAQLSSNRRLRLNQDKTA